MNMVYKSLEAAIKDGFMVYDEYPNGYLVRQRGPNGWMLAIVDLAGASK